jgi:RNA polymerase sigma factor (sigma-70 family)
LSGLDGGVGYKNESVAMNDDFELLRAYVERQSEPAFTELVERHKGLVYASALRQTGDPSLAEEITQAVFTVLARKAASLRRETVLSGWLFRATRFAAADALKRERRRIRREIEAMNRSDQNQPPDEAALAWREIAPVLDESLARLGETDRHALLLRFFERKTLTEVGAALGLSEEASRKRVDRALYKLRSSSFGAGSSCPQLRWQAHWPLTLLPPHPLP